MMLARKLLRDMLGHKIQFLTIFLMSFLGVFIYSGMNAEWLGLRESFNDYADRTNLADMWVIGKDFSKEDANKIQALDGVRRVERRLVLDAAVDLENNPVLRLNFTESNGVSSSHMVEGEDFSPDKKGVWISTFFAEARGLDVGDRLSFSIYGLKLDEKIRGIIMNPEYVYSLKDEKQYIPDNTAFGFAFLSSGELPEELRGRYNQMVIDTEKSAEVDTIGSRITGAMKGKTAVILTRNSQTSCVYFDSEIKSHRNMSDIFPLVFLLIAFLAVMTSMIRISTRQRTQIGALKAFGFSDARITFHYVSYGIWISLAGGILGLILGPLTVPPLVYGSLENYFALPVYKPRLSPSIFLITALSVAASALASWLACRKELRDPPAQTLRPLAPKAKKPTWLERSKLWRKAGFPVQWNFRDIRRNKIRTVMGMISVAGSMMLVVGALAMRTAVDDIFKWTYKELYLYNSKILLANTATPGEIENMKLKYDGQLVEEDSVEIVSGERKRVASLTVLDDGNLIRFEDKLGNPVRLAESGIAVTYKMAEVLGADIGDMISWRIYGGDEWQTAEIAQLYRTPADQGMSMTRSTFENMGHTFMPTSVLSEDNIDTNLKTAGIDTVLSKSKILENLETQLQFVDVIVGVMVFGAVLLGVVMIYNIGIISITEKTWEISLLKVLGFRASKLRNILQTQNVWITAGGILLGIPLALALADSMLGAAGDSFDMRVVIPAFSWFAAIAGTFALSVLVSFMLSRKVKAVDMVENLKGVE